MIGIDAIAELVSTAVDKIWPDANIEAQSKADQLKSSLTAELQGMMGQLEINKIEASSSSMLVAGARPYVIWICGTGFAYEYIVRPLINGFMMAFGLPGVFPGIEIEALSVLLFNLLGFAGMRTVEKFKGVARDKL